MFDVQTLSIVIAGSSLLISGGMIIFNGSWGLSSRLNKIATAQSTALTAMESRLAQTVAETARDLEERQEKTSLMFGESVKAVREQLVLNEKEMLGEVHELSDRIRKVEIWTRDEFVRKESFREICARIENTVAEQGRNVNNAVQSVRDAIMTLATNGKIDKHDR